MDEQAGAPPPVGARGDQTTVRVGHLVRSIQGRDLGRLYFVVKVDPEGYVWVADGEKRTLAAPKRKNRKHLWVLDYSWEELANTHRRTRRVSDKLLRENLLRFAEPSGVYGEEVDDSWQRKT